VLAQFLIPPADGSCVAITASEARQRLFPLIEEVNEDQVAVEIVSKKGTAFLVSVDEYHSLKETVYLLQFPANARRLRDSLAESTAGGAASRPRRVRITSRPTGGTTTPVGG
jgi:antitoxin YefM